MRLPPLAWLMMNRDAFVVLHAAVFDGIEGSIAAVAAGLEADIGDASEILHDLEGQGLMENRGGSWLCTKDGKFTMWMIQDICDPEKAREREDQN